MSFGVNTKPFERATSAQPPSRFLLQYMTSPPPQVPQFPEPNNRRLQPLPPPPPPPLPPYQPPVIENAGSFGEVHQYDGFLQWTPKKLFTEELYRDLYNDLLIKLKSEEAKRMVVIIRESQGNYDDRNKINAFDLLAHIASERLTQDLLDILDEQLKDTYLLGQCPQGRTTRLFQVYKAFTT